MKKKEPPDSDQSIELDLDHQRQIEKVHEKRRDSVESSISEQRASQKRESHHANISLQKALSGATQKTNLEKKCVRVAQVLFFLSVLSDLFMAFRGGRQSFFNLMIIFGFAMRPYLVVNLVTLFWIAFTQRLSLSNQFRELMHAIYIAKPEGKLADEVNGKISRIRFTHQTLSLLVCIFGVSTAFSLLGWEPAFTHLGGARFSIVFFLGMGFLIWIAMFKVFALKE